MAEAPKRTTQKSSTLSDLAALLKGAVRPSQPREKTDARRPFWDTKSITDEPGVGNPNIMYE